MSTNQELVAKGLGCIAAARKANDLILTKSQAKEAAKYLAALEEDGEQLQRAAKEAKHDFMEQEEKLRKEMAQLEVDEQRFECQVSSLRSSKSCAECKLKDQERALSDACSQQSQAEGRLRNAESELSSAREKEAAIAIASVASGLLLGAVTLGLGGLAIGAVAGSATATIAIVAEGRVKDAKHDIRRCCTDVEASKKCVLSTRDTVSSIQRDIDAYQQKIQVNKREASTRHEKVTGIMKSIEFSEMSINFWEDFKTVSKHATKRSERLKALVNKATKKDNIRVLRTNGTVIIAESFVEAWEEVLKKGQIMPA